MRLGAAWSKRRSTDWSGTGVGCGVGSLPSFSPTDGTVGAVVLLQIGYGGAVLQFGGGGDCGRPGDSQDERKQADYQYKWVFAWMG